MMVGSITVESLLRYPIPTEYRRQVGGPTDYWATKTEGRFHVKIAPGGKVHPHSDAKDPMKTHVVLQTNPDAWWRSGTDVFHMPVGTVWHLDASIEHEAWNNGTSDRIHLIFGYDDEGSRAEQFRADIAAAGLVLAEECEGPDEGTLR